MAANNISNHQSPQKQPLLSENSVVKPGSTRDEVRQVTGSLLEPLFSQGDTVAIASLTQKIVTQEASPLQAGVGDYTAASISGLTGIFGIAFHSMNYQRARKNKDATGLRVYSSQLVRFVAKVASVATSIASIILTKSGEVLGRSSSILGAISTMSGTVAFSFRLYDMHKLKRLEGNIDAIHNEFFKIPENPSEEIIEGQIDRLGRALGDRDLAVKIYEKKSVSESEIQEKIQGTFKDFAICLVVFLISDAINIVALVIPIIKPLGMALSLAANALWLTLVDGKFLVKELSEKKQISTALKAAYIAQIVLATASIVASTVFSFGAVPIAIGAAAVVATLVPHFLGWLERKKRAASQQTAHLSLVEAAPKQTAQLSLVEANHQKTDHLSLVEANHQKTDHLSLVKAAS